MLMYAPAASRSVPCSSPEPTARSLPPARRLLDGGGTVTPLRRRAALALGGLPTRTPSPGEHLVTALDTHGSAWWIPAAAVWSDADIGAEHLRATGLATARTWAAVTVAGLSDRLGWEAVLHIEAGGDLPAVPTDVLDDADIDDSQVVVLDGRLDHTIPTVVVLGPDVTRWGAGASWDRALHRALYGLPGGDDPVGEMRTLAAALGPAGLRPVTVDVGSARLRDHGIMRGSVQLLVA